KDLRQIVFDEFGPYSAPSGSTSTSPCKRCNCNEEKTVISCQGQEITQSEFEEMVPKLSKKVKILDFSANSIETIAANQFSDLTNLIGLDLSYNTIETFEDNSLDGLSNLISLLIDGNSFTSLPAALLADLTLLEELSAANNGAWTGAIPSGWLSTNTELQFLSIFGSFYNELPAGLFTATTKLFLLSTVVSGLDSSGISWPSGVLDPLVNLQQLHVQLNGPPCSYNQVPDAVTTGVAKMTELRAFVLWGCQEVTELPKKFFDANTKLELVYLFNNGITSFDKNLFQTSEGNLQMLLVDVNNHTTQCAYAARSDQLYPPFNSRPEVLADETSYVCNEVCGEICPMIQKAKRKNPGVYVLYGNFREQTIDTGFGA
ncbi:Chondroadherin (Cartilage leucine-rich protein), partial [Durusdinium trenchii]